MGRCTKRKCEGLRGLKGKAGIRKIRREQTWVFNKKNKIKQGCLQKKKKSFFY